MLAAQAVKAQRLREEREAVVEDVEILLGSGVAWHVIPARVGTTFDRLVRRLRAAGRRDLAKRLLDLRAGR